MKTFVVIFAVAAFASADIGLGYHYGPHTSLTSYETPSYSAASSSSGYNTGYAGQNTGVYKGQTSSTGLNSYQTPIRLQNGYPSQTLSTGAGHQGSGYQSGAGYQTGTGYQSGGYQSGAGYQSGIGYQSGSGYQTGTGYQTGVNNAGASGTSGSRYQTSSSIGTLGSAPLQSGYQGFNQHQSSSQYESNTNYQQYYNQIQQQPPQIFKHFYVHAAPEEPELAKPRQPIVLPAPQKHYKIIFIKAPIPATGSTQFIPVQQQNEEKTIVYVLVKKPEAPEDVVVPQIEQKPPSKPEVYFIKYKGKEDSQNVINNIVNEYNSGMGTVHVANTGTLDSISDVKYTSQSSQSAGNNAGASSQVLSGSFGSQYETSSGSVDQSFNSGSGNTGSSSSNFQSQSFESSTGGYPSSSVGYPLSTGGHQVSTGAPIQVSSSTGGYDSNFAGSVSSTSGSSESGGYNQVNTISSSQGIPHETYGPPKFRDNQ